MLKLTRDSNKDVVDCGLKTIDLECFPRMHTSRINKQVPNYPNHLIISLSRMTFLMIISGFTNRVIIILYNILCAGNKNNQLTSRYFEAHCTASRSIYISRVNTTILIIFNGFCGILLL